MLRNNISRTQTIVVIQNTIKAIRLLKNMKTCLSKKFIILKYVSFVILVKMSVQAYCILHLLS